MAKYEPRSLKKWMKKISADEIALPEFQRGFVWEANLVANLFRSLLLNRPVGVLLLLSPTAKTNSYFTHRSFPNVMPKGDMLKELVLDGQQRLTSIWQVLSNWKLGKNGAKQMSTLEHEFVVQVEKLPNGNLTIFEVTGQQPKSTLSPEAMWSKHQVPLRILGFDGVTQDANALERWCGEACNNVADQALELKQAVQAATKPLRKAKLWFTSLGENFSREECIEMFVTVNESNAKVSHFDIAVAEFSKPRTPVAPRERIEDWLRHQTGHVLPFLASNEEENIRNYGELMLRIACLRAGMLPTIGNYKEDAVQLEFEKNFDEIGDGISYFYNLVFADGVSRRDLLPSEMPLQVVAALHSWVKDLSQDRAGQAGILMRSYIWQAFLTTRYNLGTNSRLREDYQALLDILEGTSVDEPYASFRLPGATIPTISDMCKLNGPLSGVGGRSSMLRAFLAMSSLKARDFATGAVRIGDGLGVQQRHHLFPKRFLQDNLGSENNINVRHAINHVLNYALIDGLTNAKLGGKAPREYLKDRLKEQPELNEEDLQHRIESHVIPYKLLNVGEGNVRQKYELFIKGRAGEFAKIIEGLVGRDAFSAT